METISVGERKWIVVEEDQIYIREKKHTLNLIYIVLFVIIESVLLIILVHFNVGGVGLLLGLGIPVFVLIRIILLFQIQEIHFDPNTQQLRKYLVVLNRKIKVKLLFSGPQKLHFAWMFGRITVNDDEFIEGFELVAYINPKYHKDLVFFKTNSSKEDLTAVFKELLEIDIHDRMSDKLSRLVM
jgi:hypothetical protein